MKNIVLPVPDQTNEKEVKMLVAASLFDKGILSSGQAAEMVGISKRIFLETVGKFGVSIFGETADDIRSAKSR